MEGLFSYPQRTIPMLENFTRDRKKIKDITY
jgi:hypothetical protein